MGESKRQLRVAKQLQKDISDILRKKLGDQLRNTMVTVTRVQVSPDLGVARIYLSIMSVDKSQNVMSIIQSRKSEIRKALGLKIGKQVRIIPELIFVEDSGAQHATDIDHILSNLDIPPQED